MIMEKCSFKAFACTQKRTTAYDVALCKVLASQGVLYERKEYFSNLCRTGCKNYCRKWSCPPCSPSFTILSSSWNFLYILYLRMPLAIFSDVQNEYLRVKAANSMLKSRADKYVRTLAKAYGKPISTGSCRLCKPCGYQNGQPCAHPDLMAYSFESLGINVCAMVNDYFDFPLLWYKKGHLPEYTSVVCGLLSNESISLCALEIAYCQIIKESSNNNMVAIL